MNGVFLCKFDENQGFIPVKPIYIDDKSHVKDADLMKEIARNAIGFGSELDFNSFSLKGVNCISQRFSIADDKARGGSETFALVIISDEEVDKFKSGLKRAVKYLIADWAARKKILQQLQYSLRYPEQALVFKDEEQKTLRIEKKPIYSHDSFSEHARRKSILSEQYSVGRNFAMVIACTIILITILMIFLYSKPFETFNFWKYSYTNVLMFAIGLFIYSALNKKKFVRVVEYSLIALLFVIPIYTILTLDVIFDLIHLWTFFTGLIAGLFICMGLDHEGKIDYISFYILIFMTLLVILFVCVYILTS